MEESLVIGHWPLGGGNHSIDNGSFVVGAPERIEVFDAYEKCLGVFLEEGSDF